MEGLLSLLIFAGLFYVMMRFGGGAHKAHENPGRGGAKIDHQDPVCGMEVDMTEGYGKMVAGRLYRCCSGECLDKFEAQPERYSESEGGEK